MPVTVDNGYFVLAALWLLVEPGCFFFYFLSSQGEESPFLIGGVPWTWTVVNDGFVLPQCS